MVNGDRRGESADDVDFAIDVNGKDGHAEPASVAAPGVKHCHHPQCWYCSSKASQSDRHVSESSFDSNNVLIPIHRGRHYENASKGRGGCECAAHGQGRGDSVHDKNKA
jgi:hypothetical protein